MPPEFAGRATDAGAKEARKIAGAVAERDAHVHHRHLAVSEIFLGALLEFAGQEDGAGLEEVSVALVAAGIGDTILVHAGEAIAVLGGDLDD